MGWVSFLLDACDMGSDCKKTQRCIADRARGFPQTKCLEKESFKISGWLKFHFYCCLK